MISSLYKKHSITFFYLMLLLVFSHSFISAQTPDMPFNIYLKQASLKEFTAKIEQLSEYSFIYGEEVVLKHPITLDLKETPLTTILQTAFIKQDISFEITKHHIILKKTTSLPIKQHFTLNGYVLDEISKETLIGANIYDQQNKQGTITNPFGFFSITLPEGNTELNFSYIGYGSKQIALYLCKDTLLTVQLKNDNTLEEIVVLSDKMETGFQSSRMGANNIPLTHIKNTPALLSEADVLKSIQLLPGIQGGITGTSGLYVRGGSPDQNLYLLDGVPLYNVDHTLGILSIFTPESVKKVDLYKSSFPARYGGRLSSVIDVRTNDGDMRNYHGSLTIGLLTSRMHFEGPLWKDRTSFIISARRSYADLIIKPFMDKDTKGGYYLYDINTKLNHRFSDRDRLFFSFYHGKDHASFTNTSSYYFEEEKETDTRERQVMAWGSTLGALRWNHIVSNRLFHNITLSYNRFRFNIKNNFTSANKHLDSQYYSGIEDWGLTSDFDFHPSPSHFIKFGGNYLYHTFRPETQHTFVHSPNEQEQPDKTYTIGGNEATHSHEISLYVEDDFKWNEQWKTNIGAHFSLFQVQKHTYASLEPRITVSFKTSPNLTFKAAYTHMTQYVHLLSSSNLSLPTDLWVPVTQKIRPMRACQFSIGGYYTGIQGWEFSVEGYSKITKNVMEYKDGNTLVGNSIHWEEKVEMGKGRNFGIEFMLEKKTGRTTGWINYTLAKADRIFSKGNVNGGKRFPYKYDRRHSVNITINRRLNKKVYMSASWIYASGNTATLPKEKATIILPEGSYGWGHMGNTGNGVVFPIEYSSSRNNYRLPASHQLNLGFNFHKKTKHGERIWNVSIMNAYNSLNPNHVFIDYYTDEQSEGKKIPVIQKVTLLPFLPSFSYTYKF